MIFISVSPTLTPVPLSMQFPPEKLINGSLSLTPRRRQLYRTKGVGEGDRPRQPEE